VSGKDIVADLKRYQDSLRAEEAGFFNLRSLLRRLRQPRVAVPIAIVLALIAAAAIWYTHRQSKIRWAQEVAIPEIERLADEGNYTAAYLLAQQAAKYIPNDQALNELLPTITGTISIESNPPGADVYIKNYATENDWTHLGKTPLEKSETSRGFKHWKITKTGYETIEGAIFIDKRYPWELKITLDKEGTIPSAMVHINAVSYSIPKSSWPKINAAFAYKPKIFGLQGLKPVRVGEYFIDKYEV
jgi:hypothetical protein